MANNSLGKLGFATGVHADTAGTTQTSLNACNGSANASVSMGEFLLVPSELSAHSPSYSNYTTTISVTFSTSGAKSSRIYTRAANFDNWTSNSAAKMGFTNYGAGTSFDADYDILVYISGAGDGWPTCILSTVFRDYYNSTGTSLSRTYTLPFV